MNSKEEMQIAICLRKYSFAAIEKELLQLTALPNLQEEHKLQSLKLLHTLGENRSASTEQQQLNYENGHLIAKRVQKQREINDLNKWTKEIHEQCSKLEQLIEQEEIADDQDDIEYEAKLTEINNKGRQYANIYNEEMTKAETEKVDKILSDELALDKMYQDEIDELKQALDNKKQDVPDNISVIVGERQLEKKLNSLTNKYSHLKMKY